MIHPISPTPETDTRRDDSVAVLDAGEQLLAEIYVYVGQEMVRKYVVEHGEYLLGRDEGCHISIDADKVSRHHARLTFNAYELVIEDLGSSNGLFIDGVQIQLPTRLSPDQEVQIGVARLYVRLNDAASRQLAASLWDADLGLAPVREQLVGQKYKVLTTLARGGMGVILQARDLRIRRTVAMKVMKSGSHFSRENVLRFIDEAQLTGQLDHPNIVPVYELGIDEHGETFYTMKFIQGITLDEVLRGIRHGRKEIVEKYPLGTLLTIFQKICDAVAFAHSKGVVHRDLKPENVMIGRFGEVFVMDWGLAKQMAAVARPENGVERVFEPQVRDPRRSFETMNGVVVGTPPYISPEQARGELDAVDSRSDVYVLGAILYAILGLRAPVETTTMEEVLDKIIAGDIRPPSLLHVPVKSAGAAPQSAGETIALVHCPNGRVPEGLSAVVMKAMHVTPTDRYQSVEEMQADITAYQGGFAPKAERAGWWRQALLFAGRHKREVLLLFICAAVLQLTLVASIIGITQEKNHALDSEKRAKESQAELAKAIAALRGTAPTFAAEAASLLDDQKPDEALEKIDYAIEQVPNEPSYHSLRGNILQSLLRFDEAVAAYQEALQRNPKDRAAKDNLQLTKRLLAQIGPDGDVPPAVMRQLHTALVNQKRVGEALGVLDEIGRDQQLFFKTWKAALENRGLGQRFETKEDETLSIDLSRLRKDPNLSNLRGAPVSGLNLDELHIKEISALKGLPLKTLSLSHTEVRDLTPLAGMPLRTLNLDGVPVASLAPLAKLPIEWLRLSGTPVSNLGPLRGMKLEQLNLSGCRGVKDLTALAGMPLEKLDLSRTRISDLAPLVQSPIRELNLDGCVELSDLRPLMEIRTLETVLIPAHCKDIGYLREHPGIKRLSYSKLTQAAEDFWREWDARQAARSN